MPEAQKDLHALNRLTFGARPGDLAELRQTGLQKWIEQQLHPESIPENPVLESKLQPLETLRMAPKAMLTRYPTPQLMKAMAEGTQPLPTDPETHYMVERAVAKYKQKKQGDAQNPDDQMDAKASLAALKVDEAQKQILRTGKPQEKVALIESMPEQEQWEVLDALPNGAKQQLFPTADAGLRRKIQVFSGPMQVVSQDLVEGKILRAVYSNRQLQEVLTDFWFNHFNVDVDKGQDKYMVTAYERDAIRPHVLGKFKDLLLATAQSPAMLFYLDNWQSVGPNANARPGQKNKQGLNENYGRELMELHTLGVDGGYTQHDVTEVARCFTGWGIAQPLRGGGFIFNERQHDNGEKHVLGVTIAAGGGMEDGLKVIDILAHSPATASFIAKSLALRFVSDDPPPSLVQKMASTFSATDGDLREVMRTMIEAPEFWNPANFRSKVKSPLEMVASAIRAVDGNVDYAFALNQLMIQLGEPLYRKLEPTGYSNRSTDWMNSASLLARMNFAVALTQGKVKGLVVDTSQFAGDPNLIKRKLLMTDPTPEAQGMINSGIQQQSDVPAGPLVAGLTLGSPDFQRR